MLYIRDMVHHLNACPALVRPLLIILFADDLTMLAASLTNMCKVVNHLEPYFEAWGLRVSWARTKVMSMGLVSMVQSAALAGHAVEVMQFFSLLGITLYLMACLDRHATNTISRASPRCHAFRN
jgi:hypothetical protein